MLKLILQSVSKNVGNTVSPSPPEFSHIDEHIALAILYAVGIFLIIYFTVRYDQQKEKKKN